MPVSTAIERPALINQGAIHTSRFLEDLNNHSKKLILYLIILVYSPV